MITWFQRVFGKHNKWILMIFLVVMLISFIIGIGAVPHGAMTGARTTKRMFLGVDLNNQEEMANVQKAVMFTYANLYGNQLQDDQQLMRLMDQRVALKYLADQWQIPEATPKQLEDYVRTLRAFRDADGNFSPDRYIEFRDKVQTLPAANRDEIVSILNEDCRLDRVARLMGGPGYNVPGAVMPAMVQILNGQDNFKYDLEAATLDRAKFEPKIEDKQPALDVELRKIFDAAPAKFQRPPQVDLALVKFPAAPAPEPTADQLRDYLAKHKDDFPGVATPTPDDWLKVAKAWNAEQKSNAIADAKIEAIKFAKEIVALNAQLGSPPFAAVLKKYNKTVQPLPTLVRGTPAPADSPVADDDLQSVAFNLSPQNPLTPVPLADGAGILFFIKGQPPQAATFEQARDDVLKVYREQETAKQFTAKGADVSAAITQAMSGGKSFREAAEAQGLTVKSYSGVSDVDLGDAAMQILDPTAKDLPSASPLAAMGRDVLAALTEPDANHVPFLLTLHPGEVSKMIDGRDVGMMFHVLKREPAQISPDSPELKRALESIARQESDIGAAQSVERFLQAAQQTLPPKGS